MTGLAVQAAPRVLDIHAKQDVGYCIENWLRDEQIKVNLAKCPHRLTARYEKRPDPIALINFGPSLSDTWEQVKNFQYVMTCSGAHKFMVERGIVPTWHVDVDPRPHKVTLVGEPQKETEYLIAATCHPKLFEHLQDYNVKLWHIFDSSEEGLRSLPHGEWAWTGGCSVGVRLLTLARALGFTEFHVFGMDGCARDAQKHAADHPNKGKADCTVEYEGKTYWTTPAMLEAARNTWHEMDMLVDCTATFYGEGLVQEMAKRYVRKKPEHDPLIGFNKPELISAQYVEQNRALHETSQAYGVGGGRYAPVVLQMAKKLETSSILDYGCGKGYLAKAIPFPIWEYDPAVPGKHESPRPADLVICTDVLEHVERDHLQHVLGDLCRCTKRMGYFVIHTGASKKALPDGRNAHLIQQPASWWKKKLKRYFTIALVKETKPIVHVVVTPKVKASAQEKAA